MDASLTRREALRLGALSAAATACLAGCRHPGSFLASDVTTTALPPFDPGRATGPTTALPRRVAFANTSDTELFVALGLGAQKAASDRGLDFVTALANGDPAKNVADLRTFLARGVGSLIIQPLNQAAQNPLLRAATDRGICVQGIITWPSTLQIAARQYAIGFTQGKAAADYAVSHLGGQAQVCYLQEPDISPQLAVRRDGVLAGLRTGGPGVRVVARPILLSQTSISAGYSAILSVIQAHPQIRIILGQDSFVVGAYRALDDVGKLNARLYLSGVDGDTNALDLVRQGGPYRASLAFPWQLMGYAMGQFAADWVEGRQIPRVMVVDAPLINSEISVDTYLADNADPAPVFADPARLAKYMTLLGNLDYTNRQTVWDQAYAPA